MAQPERLCVGCRRPAEAAWAPFCSERCQLVDLGRWLAEDYRIASTPPPDTAAPDHEPQDDE
ncbi:MAG: DNA gyrase inhibitor YacG [Acidobacteria bacterium]|nr:DNA gyrase inhibitor YacG [Acidobacteriota bacterium]